MATATLRPNHDETLTWTVEPSGSTHWSVLDDAVEQPTEPDLTNYIADPGAAAGVEKLGFTTITLASFTQVDLWVHGECGTDAVDSPSFDVHLRPNATSNTNLATVNVPEGSAAAWRSATWTGSPGGQTDIDTVQVAIESSGSVTLGDLRRIYAIYLVVTYLPVVVLNVNIFAPTLGVG